MSKQVQGVTPSAHGIQRSPADAWQNFDKEKAERDVRRNEAPGKLTAVVCYRPDYRRPNGSLSKRVL